MKLELHLKAPGYADGIYHIRSRGCLAAVLYWADSQGAIPGWTPFAYVPIAPNGVREFRFNGGRAVPREATHVLARGIWPDMSIVEESLAPLLLLTPPETENNTLRLAVVTDLHLSSKPWTVLKALRMAEESDAVLCAGDMVNDGLPEQYTLLREAIEECLPMTPLLAVAGNHDYPLNPDITEEYPSMQCWLLNRAREMGLSCKLDESGAYAMDFHGMDIIGLNVAGSGRKLAFQKEGQLPWLDRHLEETKAPWHIILCHTPLIAHNPQRGAEDTVYFSRNGYLQRIVDSHRNIIFLSGHTHISFNCLKGCADADPERNNLYINCGSIRPTTLKPEEPLQPKDWTDGNIVRLELTENQIEMTAVSLESGKRIARGYYRFYKEEKTSHEI